MLALHPLDVVKTRLQGRSGKPSGALFVELSTAVLSPLGERVACHKHSGPATSSWQAAKVAKCLPAQPASEMPTASRQWLHLGSARWCGEGSSAAVPWNAGRRAVHDPAGGMALPVRWSVPRSPGCRCGSHVTRSIVALALSHLPPASTACWLRRWRMLGRSECSILASKCRLSCCLLGR